MKEIHREQENEIHREKKLKWITNTQFILYTNTASKKKKCSLRIQTSRKHKEKKKKPTQAKSSGNPSYIFQYFSPFFLAFPSRISVKGRTYWNHSHGWLENMLRGWSELWQEGACHVSCWRPLLCKNDRIHPHSTWRREKQGNVVF